MSAEGTAVIVLNWNGAADTRSCLRSLEAARRDWSHCIVVDNASTDRSVEMVRREFPWAELIEAGGNLGYAGGNNLGMRAALAGGAREILILNNDATIDAGTIEPLREAVRRDPAIGIVGPVVHHANGFSYAGGRLSRRPFRVWEIDDSTIAASPDPVDVDYVPGCAMFLGREALDRIGLLDERFFLTWEDTDLGARAIAQGLRCVVVGGSRIHHEGSQSFDRIFSPLYSYYYFRNMLLFAHLHFPPADRPAAYRNAVGYTRKAFRLAHRAGNFPATLVAVALAFLHFGVGRFGAAPEALTRQALRARTKVAP
jgi:hypothetical protein